MCIVICILKFVPPVKTRVIYSPNSRNNPLNETWETARNDCPLEKSSQLVERQQSNRMFNEETEELDDGLVNIKNDISEFTNGKVSIMEDAD